MTGARAMQDVIDRAHVVAAEAMVPRHRERALLGIVWALAAVLFVAVGHDLGFSLPRLFAGLLRLGHLFALAWPPTADGQALVIVIALGQTVAMAFLATILVVAFALPLGILGARTIVAQPIFHFAVRRAFDIGRSVPAMVWAIILVAAFGLGPRVGVTAIVLSETPHIAKLFAETMENHKRGIIESLQATGASRLQTLRYGLIPQVLPLMIGMTLLLFESNIRAAAALGLVGAGGIGVLLDNRIQMLQLNQVAWIIILFVLLVLAIDIASQTLRRRLIKS